MGNHLGVAIAALGGATILGFYGGNLVKRVKLPSVVGYMALGVILGPSLLGLFSKSSETGVASLHGYEFITKIALGFVAFSIGSELNVKALRRLGSGIVAIILGSSFLAFALVTLGMYVVSRDWVLSLLFGAMAPATAPAGTVAVILEYRAKGALTQALYAVVGFDDGLAIIIFGFAYSLAKVLLMDRVGLSGSMMQSLLEPFLEIGYSALLGGGVGLVFCFLMQRLTKTPEIFVLLFGTVLLLSGVSEIQIHLGTIHFHGSLILSNMVMGFVMCNTRKESFVKRVSAPLLTVMPLLFVMFFCLAGAHLELKQLPKMGAFGVVYIVMRGAGKVFGANLGGMVGNLEGKIKKWCGLAILAQAGVAIGLSLIVANDLTTLSENVSGEHAEHVKWLGVTLLTTITASCIFFEIVGPILAKVSLTKAGEINKA